MDARAQGQEERAAGGGHPYVLIGLGMLLIAGLTVIAVWGFARHRGISPTELADFRRWRRRVQDLAALDAQPEEGVAA